MPACGLREWEKDFQLRYRCVNVTFSFEKYNLNFRTLENILDSKSILSSLAHLLRQIPNIVISDLIGTRVETSIQQILSSSKLLKQGNLQEGYSRSREAIKLAETAFFDKSLLELLYFPDDQKYAIYIPYFLPVGLPVILSVKNLIKYIKEKRKTKVE